MKHIMKQTVSLILCLAVLACLLPMGAVAAGGTLETAAVSVTYPTAGVYPVPAGDSADPDRYTVKTLDYYPVDDNGRTGKPLGWNAPFEQGVIYRIYLILTPGQGWSFSQDTKVTIDNRKAKLVRLRDEEAVYQLDVKCGLTPFTDVKDDAWYANAVKFCSDNKLMAGTGDGWTFSPNMSFSRAMFVTVLAQIDGAKLSAYTTSSFRDVKPGKWYAPAVEWAYQKGYTDGIGDGYYGPNDPVTRETLAVFFYNYTEKVFGKQDSTGVDLSAYPDGRKVSSWARSAMAWAVSVGLIGGREVDGKTYLQPKQTAVRSEVATIIMKYMQKFSQRSVG